MRTVARGVVLVSVGVFAIAGAAPALADLIIDDFGEVALAAQVISLINPDPTLASSADPGILGGERDLLLDVMGAAGPVAYSGSVGQGTLAFNSSQPGTAATLQYDGIDTDIFGPPAGLINNELLGGIDFTASGSGLYLDFLSIDGGQVQTTGIQIEAHNGAAVSTFAGAIADAAAPFRYNVPFAAFSDPAVFSHVTSLTLSINPAGANDVDFVLDLVGVPEPGTLAFLGLGLALLRWRKR